MEELNEMIAYKKSLVDVNPRGLEPGQRTCIDYDHGRINMPVRSILKKRPEGPEYQHPTPYSNLYYDAPYSQYKDWQFSDRYGDPYTRLRYDRPYGERPYDDRPLEGASYGKPPYGGASQPGSSRYTDRYDVYDDPYEDRPYQDVAYPARMSHSPDPRHPSPTAESAATTKPHSSATSFPQTYEPPSLSKSPPRSPSPERKPHRLSPLDEKPPLDRFLDMLNKKDNLTKKLEPPAVTDDLLPHERALQEGGGFSCILGLAQEQPTRAQEEEEKKISPKGSSVETTSDDPNSNKEPYDKIQSLLRSIGLKLSSVDMSKLASQAQEKIYSQKSSSTERETSIKREHKKSRAGSFESDSIPNSSSTRSSSVDSLVKPKAFSDYEGFLNQQELETLMKAQHLQSLTKKMESTSPCATVPKPPPAQYVHPPSSFNWPLGGLFPSAQSCTAANTEAPALDKTLQRFGCPPGPPSRHPGQHPSGPPSGPPSQRPAAQPCLTETALPFVGQLTVTQAPETSSSPHVTSTIVTQTPAASGPVSSDQASISTTMARCLQVIETVKSLAVQPSVKPVKSVQFNLPAENPAMSAAQNKAETDEDVMAKQKEKVRPPCCYSITSNSILLS